LLLRLFKAFDRSTWVHPILLLLWISVGAALRFAYLDAKPLWNDELATIVFSLGNSLRTVPMDQPISLDTLLAPLQPNPVHGFSDVIDRLLTESTHPPIYFLLTHLWLKLFPTDHGWVTIGAARSLAALLGVMAIPAMFGFGWLAFRSAWVGQNAAALMAVSPYGIYLAQEARHYTLAVLLIIASLTCLLVAVRSLTVAPWPLWLCLVWVGINSLGVAIHYFFTLVLVTEAIALSPFMSRSLGQYRGKHQLRLYGVAIATLISVLIWLPAWRNVTNNELTQWIYNPIFLSHGPAPLGRLVVWMVTMVAMPPVEGVPLALAIAAGSLLVAGILWLLPTFLRELKMMIERSRSTQALLMIWLGAIALILCITYGFHADLTIAARYQFIYFPGLLVLIAGAVTRTSKLKVLLPLGLLGSLTVVTNYGYQKPDRPDQLVSIIRSTSVVPVLIATAHQTHEQTRELMGLAVEYRRQAPSLAPQFLLAHSQPDSGTSTSTGTGTGTATEVLQLVVERSPRPFDLWTVNFLPTAQPIVRTCGLDTTDRPLMHGYDYRLYHCYSNPKWVVRSGASAARPTSHNPSHN